MSKTRQEKRGDLNRRLRVPKSEKGTKMLFVNVITSSVNVRPVSHAIHLLQRNSIIAL